MTFAPIGSYAPGALVAFGAADCTIERLMIDVANVRARLPAVAPSHVAPSHVAVVCEDRYAFAVAVLAAWQAGHAVALPPSGRPAAVALVAARPGVVALLHDTAASDGIDFRSWLGADGSAEPLAALAADRVVATFFSSGSGGDFQASAKTAAQLFLEVATLQRTFGLEPDQRVVATVPPHHLYGFLFGVLWPLAVGAAFGRDVPLHGEAIAARCEEAGPSAVVVTVPAHLAAFASIAPGRLRGVLVFSLTAPLSPELARALGPHELALREVFGSTETGGIAWRAPADDPRWRPLAGVEVGVAPEDDRLLVTSPFIEPSLPRPHRTADRVALAADGSFVHLGRADDVVKVGGRRVSLSHLEARLRSLAGVHDASVLAVPDGGPRNTLILAALVAPGWSAAALRDALLQWFEPSTLPRRFVFVDALPREATGKLTRAGLLALFGLEHDPAADRPRRTDMEWLGATRRVSEGTASGGGTKQLHTIELIVPTDLFYFVGHFPELPILPGVALVHEAVLPEVASAFPELSGLRRITRLKFRRPIRPADHLVLELGHSPGSREVDFTITRGAAVVCASGRLGFGAA